MERKINWLHLTDLHYGQRLQDILLPKIQKEFFSDFNFIREEIGKIDIVFFTGDLTQSGKKEEFDALNGFLKDLWGQLRKLGSEPLLVAIPGNHDLRRPDPTKAVVKVLKQYQTDVELKEGFWAQIKAKGEYFELIDSCFKNFTQWYQNLDLPKPTFREGLIPGDLSSEITLNDVTLKFIGLNTAFLELSNDDYFKKLVISPEQVIALSSKNPLEWVEKADISLLLTHHDASWYDEQSFQYYNNDINPGNTFYNHLCGHLHKPSAFASGIIGSELRRTQLAPSLFGLQKINSSLDRIHGYYAGSYIIQENEIFEKFCPRKAQEQYDGSYGIVPDNGFKLQNKTYLDLTFSRRNTSIIDQGIDQIELVGNYIGEINSEEKSPEIETKNILDLKNSQASLQELETIPKVNYVSLPQHLNIRLVEQKKFSQFLLEDRIAWLITDWGLGEAGFIGSILQRLEINAVDNQFILNCEDIINEDELISAFSKQFGMPLQRFCSICSRLNNRVLVLDHVGVSLFTTNLYYRVMNLLKSITDFCPRLHIIIIARQAPRQILNDRYVKLLPLDGSDIRPYLNNHISGTFSELESADNILKLLEITSGLPKHVDRIIENLKLVSFEEIIETEKEIQIDSANVDQIPKSLKQVIDSLDDPKDKLKQRSFKLLKILTVLYNGETLGNLKRIDGPNPIHLENANLLEQLSLIEVVVTNRVVSNVSGNPSQQIKILRVPRQIRDYINALITEDERDSILKLGCDMYFGNRWRHGIIRDIYSSVFGAYKFYNVDNCHVITNNLMANAIKNNDNFEIERAANLAINICEHVSVHGDYKNAVSICEEIYNWLKPTTFERLKGKTLMLYGAALRMTGSAEKSISILNEALQLNEANFSNAEINNILFDLAFTYVKQEKHEKAIECAKKIEKTVSAKSGEYVQVKYIHATATLTGSDLIQRLKTLEENARKVKAKTLTNTISLEIARLENDVSQNQKRYSKILTSNDDDDYNKIRAIISKSLSNVESNEPIPNEDLNFLNISYSYLYTQRLEVLFNKCHKALWGHCVKSKRYEDLLNLFKFSSLIWRITGDIELEKSYFLNLKTEIASQIDSLKQNPVNVANLDYYYRRDMELAN